MPKEQTPGKPQTRRYSQQEKDAAVRMVRTLRAELGTTSGTVQRVAKQLGYGVESVRTWVKQADILLGSMPLFLRRSSALLISVPARVIQDDEVGGFSYLALARDQQAALPRGQRLAAGLGMTATTVSRGAVASMSTVRASYPRSLSCCSNDLTSRRTASVATTGPSMVLSVEAGSVGSG